jgi:hypothetical protein
MAFIIQAFKKLLSLLGLAPKMNPNPEVPHDLMEEGRATALPTASTEDLVGASNVTTVMTRIVLTRTPNGAIQTVPSMAMKRFMKLIGCYLHSSVDRDVPPRISILFHLSKLLWQHYAYSHYLPLPVATRGLKSHGNGSQLNKRHDLSATHAPMGSRYLAKIRSGGMFGLVGSLHRSWHSMLWSRHLFVPSDHLQFGKESMV